MASSVFKNDMNWSTYQDKQLNVLIALERSFNTSLNMSKSLESNLSKMESAMAAITRAATDLAKYVSGLPSRGKGRSGKSASDRVYQTLNDLHTAEKQRMEERHELSMRQLEEQVKEAREALEAQRAAQKTQREIEAERKAAWETLKSKSAQIIKMVAESANGYSKASNDLIKYSGMNGESVREFRSDLMDIVSDLNTRTGGIYNPKEAYNRLVEISHSVTGSLDALKEMSEPILLAQETLEVNLSSLGDLFSRFYTRYNFSSLSMEKMVDDIRSSSAGNRANSETVVSNLAATQNLLEYLSNGDSERLSKYTEAISNMTSYYESFGLNTEFIPKLLKDIQSGAAYQDVAVLSALSKSEMTLEDAQARLNDPDKLISIVDAVLRGKSVLFTDITATDGANAGGITANAWGEDYETLMAINNYISARDNKGYTYEAFLRDLNKASAAEVAQSKYVSLTDQANNWLERIYELVARGQETFGVGLSDLIHLVTLIAGFRSISRGLSGISGAGGRVSSGLLATAGSHLAGGGVSGAAATGLGVLGVAGVGAGLGLGGLGIAGALDESKTTESRVVSGLSGGLGVAGAIGVGAGMLGAGAAAGPVGWALIGAGAIAYTVKRAIDYVNELPGNAKKVSQDFEDISKTLKSENEQRLDSMMDLKVAYGEAKSIEEKKNLIAESGILSQEDLVGKQETALDALVDAYWRAANKLDNTTEDLIEDMKSKVIEDVAGQQEALLNSLLQNRNQYTDEEYYNIVKSLAANNPEVVDRLNEYYKDGSLSYQERGYIITGDPNKPFELLFGTPPTLKNATISASRANTINQAYGIDSNLSFTDYNESELEAMARLYSNAETAFIAGNAEDPAIKALYDSEYRDAIRNYWGDEINQFAKKLGLDEYSVGSNYIEHDQLAVVHEGEAVVPKKYNPAANSAEFRYLTECLSEEQEESRKEIKESVSSFLSELIEIKEFLAEWKEDNVRREKITNLQNRYLGNSNFMNSYTRGGDN